MPHPFTVSRTMLAVNNKAVTAGSGPDPAEAGHACLGQLSSAQRQEHRPPEQQPEHLGFSRWHPASCSSSSGVTRGGRASDAGRSSCGGGSAGYGGRMRSSLSMRRQGPARAAPQQAEREPARPPQAATAAPASLPADKEGQPAGVHAPTTDCMHSASRACRPRSFPLVAVVGLDHIKHALLLGAVDTGDCRA